MRDLEGRAYETLGRCPHHWANAPNIRLLGTVLGIMLTFHTMVASGALAVVTIMIGLALLFAVLMSIVGGLVPATRAARLEVVRALGERTT